MIEGSVGAALFLGLAWVSTAFAASGGGDGDGFDGDELIWSILIVGSLNLAGLIAFFAMQRRTRSQPSQR